METLLMTSIERIKAEVEWLRDGKGIPFNEIVCYANVLRIIERELSMKSLEGEQCSNIDLEKEAMLRVHLGGIYR